ncbi:MAG: chemotaxis protein CheC [Treponema sp.]|nr:chemotaxis protein CheC [Treponema sp.]
MNPRDRRMDALVELVTLGIGQAAEVLNLMLDSHIDLAAPEIRILSAEALRDTLDTGGDRLSAVTMRYRGEIEGVSELVFRSAEAGRLVDCITGEEHCREEGLDALRADTLCEVGNIVINAIMGAVSNELHFHLTYSVPSYLEGEAGVLMAETRLEEAQAVLLVKTIFRVQTLRIEGEIAVFLSMDSLQRLQTALDGYGSV